MAFPSAVGCQARVSVPRRRVLDIARHFSKRANDRPQNHAVLADDVEPGLKTVAFIAAAIRSSRWDFAWKSSFTRFCRPLAAALGSPV